MKESSTLTPERVHDILRQRHKPLDVMTSTVLLVSCPLHEEKARRRLER